MKKLIQNYLHFNCLHNGFVIYNDSLIACKRNVITTITDSIIPVDFCQINQYVINFSYDEMISKAEAFAKQTLYILSNQKHDNIMASNSG